MIVRRPVNRPRWAGWIAGWIGVTVGGACAQPFHLPTANRALFEPDGAERFFVGTPGKPCTSGTFGCVRSEGWQLHEGIDIRCVQRDSRGEPTDPVLASAEGRVAYINRRSALSTYGNYVILSHRVDGVEVYSLYAHLREVRADLHPGATVQAGESIAVMGRTSNTRQRISKDRAHLHFELALLLNERFSGWYKKTFKGQRNDHGSWNGQNFIGLDPVRLFLAQHQSGAAFSIREFLAQQTELCRVFVRVKSFPWRDRYAALVQTNTLAEQAGVAGYEVALNYVGLPFELIPRAATEIEGKTRFQLLSVNADESRQNPCRRLVRQRKGRWELDTKGLRLLELLTY